MPDDLYWQDGLAWSVQQAALLRRLRAGERVNAEIDWDHVIEEVEELGRSELRAVASLLGRAMEHLLKLAAWPDDPSAQAWRRETRAFLDRARHAYTASMRQRLQLASYWPGIVERTQADQGSPPAFPLPNVCPFRPEDLLTGTDQPLPDIDALVAKIGACRRVD